MKYELVNCEGSVLFVGTFRKCVNRANKLEGSSVRRQRPMHVAELYAFAGPIRQGILIRSGFWQPNGRDEFTGRPLYWS